MPKKEQYNKTQIREAIEAAGGIVVEAAEKLGCTPKTVYQYIKRHPDLEDARNEAREITLDLAESELIKKIKAGDTTCIIFYLKTQGKHRGYVEKQDIGVTNSGDVVIFEIPHNGRDPLPKK